MWARSHTKINLKTSGWHNTIPVTERPQVLFSQNWAGKYESLYLIASDLGHVILQSLGLIKFLTSSLDNCSPKDWMRMENMVPGAQKPAGMSDSCHPFGTVHSVWGQSRTQNGANSFWLFSGSNENRKNHLAPESQCPYMVWKVLSWLFMGF